MAEKPQEIPQEKKIEYKTIYLFGNKISVEYCSSLESNETAIPLVNVPTSPVKDAADHEDLMKTHKEDYYHVPLYLSFDNLGNPYLNFKATCAGNETAMLLLVDAPTISPEKEANKGLKKTHKDDSVSLDLSLAISRNPDVTRKRRTSKKRKYLPEEEEMQTGPWNIKKTLVNSDVGTNSRLTVEKKYAERYLNIHLSADDQMEVQQGDGVELQIYDHETNTEHSLIYKRHDSTKSYIFNGDWIKGFVKRRRLKTGDTIGFFWGADSRLHFSVLFRCFLQP